MESDIIFGLAAPVWRDHPQGRSRRGARLRHRQALVSSFSLATHIDADDMPSAGDLNTWRSASEICNRSFQIASHKQSSVAPTPDRSAAWPSGHPR